MNDRHFCSCIHRQAEALPNQKAALLNESKWPVGSAITIRFLAGSPQLRQRVRKVAGEWTKLANLDFDFREAGETDIRIAFQQGNGSWSYLGTQCRTIAQDQPTMNFGWLDDTSDDGELRRVVLHEFGHALGLIHEHQNPIKPIRWNRDAVIRDLSGPPNNWDLATIENNMFKKYEQLAVTGTAVDPTSIMMYPIPRAWTVDGEVSSDFNMNLSATDRQFIAEAYPKM